MLAPSYNDHIFITIMNCIMDLKISFSAKNYLLFFFFKCFKILPYKYIYIMK